MIYEPFTIFSPAEVALGHSFTVGGTTLDNDKEIYTTFLIAFATAGYSIEASRWCFYTDTDLERKSEDELLILCESNDYECDLAKYVATGDWIENAFASPAAYSFEEWFIKLVTFVTAKPFSKKRRDDIPNGSFKE